MVEAQYLIVECQVPVKKVASRLRVNFSMLKRLRTQGADDYYQESLRRVSTPRFAKFHERSRIIMKELFENTLHPLSLRNFQE